MPSLRFAFLTLFVATITLSCRTGENRGENVPSHSEGASDVQEIEAVDPKLDNFSVSENDYKQFGWLRLRGNVVEASSQNVEERVLEPVSQQFIRQIGVAVEEASTLDGDQTLYEIGEVRLDPAGRFLYVSDRGRMQIRRFRLTDGRFDLAFGREGQGPGEFARISDFQVAADGSVWVIDGRNRRVSVFEANAVVARSIPFTMEAHSLALPPADDRGQTYVLLSGLNKPRVFHQFDSEGNLISSFSAFTQKPLLNMGFSGRIIGSSRGFVWLPSNAGRIAGFTSTGKLDFFKETFYPTEPQRLVEAKQGFRLTELQGPVSFRLPIWSQTREPLVFAWSFYGEGPVLFTDAYHLETGDYKFTIPNPDDTTECVIHAVTDASIYTACPSNGVIKEWKREKGG